MRSKNVIPDRLPFEQRLADVVHIEFLRALKPSNIEGNRGVETEQNLPDQDGQDDDGEPPHRHFFTDIGESLILPAPPDVMGARIVAFSEFTGLSHRDMLTSPLVAHSIPFYPVSWPNGRKRWQGVKPQTMWHPLFWLPQRLSHRHRLSFRDGEVVRPENDDEWAVRVMLESQASGIYDEPSGSWIDVLTLIGIDSGDPEVHERINRWTAGGDDKVFDDLDVTPLFTDPDEPDWALDVVPSLIGDIYVLAYSAIADGLLDATTEIVEGVSGRSPRDAARAVATYAAASLARVRRDEVKWWMELIERINDVGGRSTSDLISGPVNEMYVRLSDLSDYYGPMAQALATSE